MNIRPAEFPSYYLNRGGSLFDVIIDSREQKPLPFWKIGEDIKTVKGKLDEGDYAIQGYEQTGIVFERKTIPDLYACLIPRERDGITAEGQDKEGRFYEEVVRLLRHHDAAYIVVEGNYADFQPYLIERAIRMGLDEKHIKEWMEKAWLSLRGLEARLSEKIQIRYCSTPTLAAGWVFTAMRLWLKDNIKKESVI